MMLEHQAQDYWQQLMEAHPQASWLPKHQQTLLKVLGLSDFIARSCIQDLSVVKHLLEHEQLSAPHPDYLSQLNQRLESVSDETSLHEQLRQYRRQQMVRLAWLDLTNQQQIEDSLEQVSALADALITSAADWCYSKLAERFGYPMLDDKHQPMLIIGMGKLGGAELNFSSDIDLIFCYPQLGDTQGAKKTIENQQFFTKLGQKLIAALNQITAQGQVFRVDMRLRPFGDSGPLVMHFAALEDYYQEQGREWERYAMVKGRVINTSGPFADELKAILRPFVFRRYIDFSAIDALRNMKALISKEVRRRQLTNNIKLGAGGIREVEFIVQTFQLIRGGREQDLQQPGLLNILSVLTEREYLQQPDAKRLRDAYLFLRKTEHCLQQFSDEQTQQLPTDELDRARLRQVMGFTQYAEFETRLKNEMAFIHDQFMELIGDEPEHQSIEELSDLADLWTLPLDDEEALPILQNFVSVREGEGFWQKLKVFAEEMRQRSMGKRGRETLDKLMPGMLQLVLECHKPEQLLERMTAVIKSICRRTTYLELLLENRGAMEQLTRLCSASPWIAEQITHFPILLDELLNSEHLYELTPLSGYADELRLSMLRIPEQDLEAQMEALRQFKLSQQLKIAAADVTGVLPVMEVSDHLTSLAEAVIQEVVLDAWQQMVARYGRPAGIEDGQLGFGVVAYGKLGGIELGYGSDLDLVFLHNCDSQEETSGAKAIESGNFYIKLAQRIMHLFNTKTASGDLYETDLRLRPSGNAGLLVCHIMGFAEYQQKEAWTWEHQALVRGRFVFGDKQLAQDFSDIRKQILCQQRSLAPLRDDVSKMREKMRAHLSKEHKDGRAFDLKQGRGGIADIEFLVQYWVLAHSAAHPALCENSDNVRILRTLEIHQVISPDWVNVLTQAYLIYRNAGHQYTLAGEPAIDTSDNLQQLQQQVSSIWHEVFEQ
ncbi:bifunctional [glutamate--ammonia ligase]-adenylyl-L-tyrosine phosphorylase/[glutamate--ammonia-ligase] adenylyltransferase [Lacimicrobium alkaliphilum]|uniref:Bifunctional glutamine synthetase adenylyltransferase/adenylyl-removing enzyme n=1 Tax=Lacimicrobium alkaliphilum TaxID=1526571 RepID=A0ABQ1R704_9ALTE|nr:bifunctional [glutamate--ammonia ligase]-adenylyl-L-tyrosine phosphorylase/[glutamate--ammonia-ligase] adenylyltransferase [Lacimicrobium alkaliphilum]GGD57990.1 glutamate-ammonia-ligase adenylyltransferase [Lacimicrobium alkaliphilum]